MKVTAIRSFSASDAEAAVVGMFPDLRSAPGTDPVLKGVKAWARTALTAAGFDGSAGKVAVLAMPEGAPMGRVAFVGLGGELDLEGLRQAAAVGRKAVDAAASIATSLHQVPIDGAVGAVLEGMALADYRFDLYKSAPTDRGELTVALVGGGDGWEAAADRAIAVTEAVNLARDLVNEPARAKGPLAFAQRVSAEASAHGVTAETWDLERLEAENMGGIIGVGMGSDRPPCLLELHYKPRRPKARLALVGKGIVFDSGGLSIKSADFMETMKCDMAGAAAVSAAVIAIARLGVAVEVTAYAALAENMPGGGAQRPGDVLHIRNGKTIEVLNTDAEGRLVLADALSLAAESSPDLIVDLATLTGACKVALGPKIAGVFARQDEAADVVLAAAASSGERMWHMPLPSDYRPMIDSPVADMKNTGQGRYGGAITAALLLEEFVGDIPWAHIDIAGPAFLDNAEHYLPKGGTGFGVRALVELAESMAR
jgi:leucyl aminopeptidase